MLSCPQARPGQVVKAGGTPGRVVARQPAQAMARQNALFQRTVEAHDEGNSWEFGGDGIPGF